MKKLSIAATILLGISCAALGQEGMGGVTTGEAKTYTSRKTVGITDPKAPKIFEDVTEQTTLKNFRNSAGDKDKNYILDTPSGSVALLDFDNDGKLDIYLLNGSNIEKMQKGEKGGKAALYRNLGNWQFEDVTEKAGVANERWGTGLATGDYNNDGFTDIFVSNYGISRLYKNNGDGTFTDVAEQTGTALKGWHTGATFGDYDKDGRLDLFVPAYVEFDLNDLPASPADVEKGSSVGRNFCQFRGQPVMCGPRGLKGAKDTLLHQKADGTFEDVSDKAGVKDEGNYYGFASVFVDVDDDKDLDLLVVNDSTPKQLYINNGKGGFDESGYPSGIALNENGREQAGMGLAVGDYDNDGRVDFHITNFSDDSNTLYRNDGDSNFTDITFQAGLGEPTIPFLGWGTSFIDYDNDGWKDVMVANGHVYPVVDNFQWGTSFAQQILLFRNAKPTPNAQIRYERVGAAPGTALANAYQSRGMAIGDLDNDGKPDAVINQIDARPAVLKNVSANNNNWLCIRLIGDVAKNTPKDATGSVIYVTTGKIRQRFDLISGAGYASQNDHRVSIGLGTAAKVDKFEVVWANGDTETFNISEINKELVLKQGEGAK